MTPFRPIPQPEARKKFSPTEKLAACLAHMKRDDGSPLVPGAEGMTVKEIVGSVRFDHEIARELGGSNHPSNIVPLPTRIHEAVKTPADAKKIAKARRNRTREEEFRARMLAKSGLEDEPRDVKRRHWPKRKMSGSRNTFHRRSHVS